MMIGEAEGGGESEPDEDVPEVKRGGNGGLVRNVSEARREVSSGRLPAVLPTLRSYQVCLLGVHEPREAPHASCPSPNF